ncbi:MAG TPA: rod shape-determining protein [Candidatus Binataceae bacterium]|nr:rod shape-determining protein [Candidatus Binataceae bacterium]
MPSVIAPVLRTLSKELAIDLGTANTLVYRRGEGLVCNEPSVVAIRQSNDGERRILAIGADAKRMLGRVPSAISVIRPIRDGVISDFEATQMMLRHFIQKAGGTRTLKRPRLVVCVPSGSTSIEKRAVAESAKSVGAGEVHLVDQAIAAAIGAGMPVTEPAGSMMVDIGGGTTEIAVISLGGLVYSRSVRIAGDRFDEAIIQLLRRRYNIQIGERTAEIVKIMLGSADRDAAVETLEIKARHLAAREPKIVRITSADIREALASPLAQLIDAIRLALEQTPPEIAGDIVENGIVVAGGGALLRDLAAFMSSQTSLRVSISNDPLKAVVNGASKLLEDSALLAKVSLN